MKGIPSPMHVVEKKHVCLVLCHSEFTLQERVTRVSAMPISHLVKSDGQLTATRVLLALIVTPSQRRAGGHACAPNHQLSPRPVWAHQLQLTDLRSGSCQPKVIVRPSRPSKIQRKKRKRKTIVNISVNTIFPFHYYISQPSLKIYFICHFRAT